MGSSNEMEQVDLIDRQAAIDALTHKWDGMVTSVFDVINSLPPALPDFDEWCTDCKEYDKERNSCPRWNRVIKETLNDLQEERKTQLSEESTTSDYINRWDAIDAMKHTVCGDTWEVEQAIEAVKALPSAQPKIIYCKECKFYTEMRQDLNTGICSLACRHLGGDGFCSEAERRTDE